MLIIQTIRREVKGEMKDVKVLFGSGRLSNDPPEITEVGENKTKVMRGGKNHRFAIAIPDPSMGKFDNGRFKPKYFNCELWGKNAENLAKLGYKGQKIEVFGRLEAHTYQGKEYENLTIERFELKEMRSKKDDESSTTAGNSGDREASASVASPENNPFLYDGKPIDISDDDLPF
ncbi:single-strand DNA-binding protein [Paenibacillus sp. 1182]|uniref:single-stranded DNA-binding protein n=1 Tax=Paenibacillus sp. 1182 TaxID=2806565 RepID=UPI001AEAD4EF|nr:single-stranded DNA-binding protein [Paenibacillus sp. 1182]MBP1308663.1 single-strand DNA-binding protein [Paenibacillus sp. 1182]